MSPYKIKCPAFLYFILWNTCYVCGTLLQRTGQFVLSSHQNPNVYEPETSAVLLFFSLLSFIIYNHTFYSPYSYFPQCSMCKLRVAIIHETLFSSGSEKIKSVATSINNPQRLEHTEQSPMATNLKLN